jgi:hypothetical protein
VLILCRRCLSELLGGVIESLYDRHLLLAALATRAVMLTASGSRRARPASVRGDQPVPDGAARATIHLAYGHGRARSQRVSLRRDTLAMGVRATTSFACAVREVEYLVHSGELPWHYPGLTPPIGGNEAHHACWATTSLDWR